MVLGFRVAPALGRSGVDSERFFVSGFLEIRICGCRANGHAIGVCSHEAAIYNILNWDCKKPVFCPARKGYDENRRPFFPQGLDKNVMLFRSDGDGPPLDTNILTDFLVVGIGNEGILNPFRIP